MTISVKDLKVGDIFKTGAYHYTFKVTEVFTTPVLRFPDLVEVDPVVCGCCDDSAGKWVGYRKLTEDITTVDLIYRESDES